ncbi:helix-turn-helix transcriptional regulator [Nocardioides speluncae]|uniref:helix-turn-helix transcriptional regulator n=1 Tax=Nocardioides speluncae TaxID=2670337 RepID=UPI000D69244B|nr:helix-turn-helix transcriptional regulator [Nocardioides speluncae]
MYLRDRKKLATLMVIQERSQRDVAQAAGWRTHSYVGRLLRGEVRTLTPTAALLIARYFGVPVEDLFVLRVSGDAGRSDQSREKVA